MSIVRVALDVPLPRLFDYLTSEATTEDIGCLVSVPFGRGVKIGIVVGWAVNSEQPADKLKPVAAILRELPRLPADWLALCEFCARYYQAPLGEVMALALPPMLRRGKLPRPARGKVPAKVGADEPTAQRGGRANNALLAVADGGTAVVTAMANKAAASALTLTMAGDIPALPELLAAQRMAVERIAAARGFQTFLLHGVTGSGKTEVYLRAIAEVLTQGGQALMLVPEIALTPQLEARVHARFPAARLVVANSGVGDAARARGFLDALAGQADIVLGTRLAVFMPLPRLRLIVVDEEHDASFKQQEGVRYSARDLAIWRARQRDCAIVLGSATPALESFHHARAGRYQLLDLPQRAMAEAPPTVRLIDTRREKLQEGLSAKLFDALAQRLARGEQSLLFLNRRGYAPVLACPACGWVSRCRRCAANLVVHLADRRLRCHHCGCEAAIPQACPDCGNVDIHPFGRGTQRLAATLAERLPRARILRIDRDSASTPKKWQALLAAIHAGEADILVGTQMLAKGHDFPKLTLVGVVGADAALFAADFRAPERLFAQLMQVGGRSGRADLSGEVLIQTEYPEHPLYRALADHDYARFAQAQLDERRAAGFPPFAHQALLRAESAALAESLAFLDHARVRARPLASEAIAIYDPVPMRLYRRMALERAQLLVESASRPALQEFLARWMAALYALKQPRALRWHLDVDPLEF
jgi:primosomal protein N' (replication factor Y)